MDRHAILDWLQERTHAEIVNDPGGPLHSYRVWFFDGPDYAGADLGTAVLARSDEEALLKLEKYIYENARDANTGAPISLIETSLRELREAEDDDDDENEAEDDEEEEDYQDECDEDEANDDREENEDEEENGGDIGDECHATTKPQPDVVGSVGRAVLQRQLDPDNDTIHIKKYRVLLV